jgi:RNA polymerase sigma-70 factor, ECF subfamily
MFQAPTGPCYESHRMTGIRRDEAAGGERPDVAEGAVRPAVNRDDTAPSDDVGAERDPTEGDAEAGDGAGDPAADAVSLEHLERQLPEIATRSSEEKERDRELVRRAQAGDRRAFRELFDRHHKRAASVAYGVLKNSQDASDVVQEAFVKVYKHLDTFQGTSSFYTWLYRIVMNLSIDQLRRRKNQKPVEYDDAMLRNSDSADDTILPRMLDSNPRKTVIRRELMVRVEAALATLPEYHRQVIVLREVEGMSYEEMAEILEVPKGTIMSRLFHARRKMQAALQDYVGGDLDIEE